VNYEKVNISVGDEQSWDERLRCLRR
jgi:hypothetical protein